MVTTKNAKQKKGVKKKKLKLTSTNGVAHIHSTVNNTIINFTDLQGNTIIWGSPGTIGYKGTKKATPYAAGLVTNKIAKAAYELGLRSLVINVNGTGNGKDTSIRALQAAGFEITEINDVTAIPHNGCRPPKKPR